MISIFDFYSRVKFLLLLETRSLLKAVHIELSHRFCSGIKAPLILSGVEGCSGVKTLHWLFSLLISSTLLGMESNVRVLQQEKQKCNSWQEADSLVLQVEGNAQLIQQALEKKDYAHVNFLRQLNMELCSRYRKLMGIIDCQED